MNDIHQLFAQADSIALRYEYYPIKGIGNNENRQRVGIGQLHSVNDLLSNRSVRVDSICDSSRQSFKIGGVEPSILLFVREQQHKLPSPLFEFGGQRRYIFHGMIGGLLPYAQYPDDEIAPPRSRENGLGGLVGSSI